MPDKVFVKLRYTDTGIPEPLSQADYPWITHYIYRLSSPRDPDYFTGGNSALGYTLYAQTYLKYRVRAVKIAVTWINNTTDPVVMQHIPAMFNTASVPEPIPPPTAPVNVHPERTWFENTSLQPFAKTLINSGESTNKAVTYKQFFKLRRFIGSISADVDEGSYGSTTGSDPASINQIMLYLQWWRLTSLTNGSPTTALSGQMYTIRITYYTEFYQRRRISMQGIFGTEIVEPEPEVPPGEEMV